MGGSLQSGLWLWGAGLGSGPAGPQLPVPLLPLALRAGGQCCLAGGLAAPPSACAEPPWLWGCSCCCHFLGCGALVPRHPHLACRLPHPSAGLPTPQMCDTPVRSSSPGLCCHPGGLRRLIRLYWGVLADGCLCRCERHVWVSMGPIPFLAGLL